MVALPSYFGITGLNLFPDHGVAFRRSEGGLIITSRKFDPYWRGSLETKPLVNWVEDNELSDCLAFLSRCIDLNLRVTYVHPRRKLPQSYTTDTWPMTGDAELESVTDLRTIVVSGMDAGIQLLRGDVVELRQGDISLYRWIAEDTLVSSAIAQTLPLTPRLPIGVFAPAAVVRFEGAAMKMMIVPDSVSHDEIPGGTVVNFEVEETMR